MTYDKELGNIIHELRKISKYHLIDVFHDLVDCGILCVGSFADFSIGEDADIIMKRLLKRYSDSELRSLITLSISLYNMVAESYRDIYGELYMMIGSNKHLSQLFTPNDISDLLVRLCVGKGTSKTVSDDCCGSGSLPLALCRYLRDKGEDISSYKFFLNDLDLLCCKMATIQMAAIGADALVHCSNTLLAPPFREDYEGMWLKTPLRTARVNVA